MSMRLQRRTRMLLYLCDQDTPPRFELSSGYKYIERTDSRENGYVWVPHGQDWAALAFSLPTLFAVVFFVVGITTAYKGHASLTVTFAVSVLVAFVPEGLPSVVTLLCVWQGVV